MCIRDRINDLDVRVTSDSVVYYPWVMEPNADFNNYTAAAVKGDNFRDNTEIISVNNLAAGEYTITVSHKGMLQTGAQEFGLIINGIQTDLSSNSEVNSFEKSLTVYPNPVNNTLKIDMDSYQFESFKVSVIDVAGQKQMEANHTNQRPIELDVSTLSKGIYFLKIWNEEDVLVGTRKIVIP